MRMSVLRRIFLIANQRNLSAFKSSLNLSQHITSTTTDLENEVKKDPKIEKSPFQLAEYRFIYPEFLPDPKYEFRHKIREKLEREDMLRRRSVIDIPEFYVGSVLSVVTSDPYAPGKENKFVGICIARTFVGLRATFTLRNIVDGQGVEIMYDMYNPTLLSIEVLKLEKRLDDHLYYLRDAPPEYSTFPFDMEAEFRVQGEPVPLNTMKVPLKPPPWHAKWEQRNLRGATNFPERLSRNRRKNLKNIEARRQVEERDLVKEYRRCVPEEEQEAIWRDVDEHVQNHPPRKQAWKRTLLKVKNKTGQPKSA